LLTSKKCSTQFIVVVLILAFVSVASAQSKPENAVCELVNKRTANSTNYLMPDGTTVTEVTLGPTHFKDQFGNWLRITTTIYQWTGRGLTIN